MTTIIDATDAECILGSPVSQILQFQSMLSCLHDHLGPSLEWLLWIAAVVDGVFLQVRTVTYISRSWGAVEEDFTLTSFCFLYGGFHVRETDPGPSTSTAKSCGDVSGSKSVGVLMLRESGQRDGKGTHQKLINFLGM